MMEVYIKVDTFRGETEVYRLTRVKKKENQGFE